MSYYQLVILIYNGKLFTCVYLPQVLETRLACSVVTLSPTIFFIFHENNPQHY